MIEALEPFIRKRKKVLADKLAKGREIDLAGFFLIRTETGISEIIIPGVKAFEERKAELRAYIHAKWKDYHAKRRIPIGGLYFRIAFFYEYQGSSSKFKR